MLDQGDHAPDFALPDETNTTRTLSGELQRGPVLLYFYPADFTPGCTAQACAFRDAHAQLADLGLSVLGISPQSVESHAKFKNAHNLNFPLLADPDKQAIAAFGTAGPFGLLTRRATFVITHDPDLPAGRVAHRVLADLNIARHAALVRELAERATADSKAAG
ncbi:MAG: peroxiredoxin [Planctomycetota bacterium]